MSSRFPIGVQIIYNPFSKLFIISTLIFIASCTPVNNFSKKIILNKNPNNIENNSNKEIFVQTKVDKKQKNNLINQEIINEVEIILPKTSNIKISKSLINSFELSVYKKNIDNVDFNINQYLDLKDLDKILKLKSKPGKIFIGTLSSEATSVVKQYCDQGILFFSFTSDKSQAGSCVYLINFFPEDDLIALFNYFPKESKVALLYPENFYGFNINNIIDPIAAESKSIIVNRASYKENLSDARKSIKKLSKYEFRKKELERQKKILENKNDEISLNALKKIQKFETLGEVGFTHIILPDYSIRLLEIAPLLPFYDVDPNKVKFVGTGVWDDSAFFNEPSLQGAIFSGIEKENRNNFFTDYQYIYKEKPIRTATIPFDLVGIISYMIDNKMNLNMAYDFLNDSKIKFDGIDGKFFFSKNIIFRELDILQISKGYAKKLN